MTDGIPRKNWTSLILPVPVILAKILARDKLTDGRGSYAGTSPKARAPGSQWMGKRLSSSGDPGCVACPGVQIRWSKSS